MELRTYYWNDRKVSLVDFYKFRLFDKKRMVFRYGNAGDIFNIDLIKYLYNAEPKNLKNIGNRLLLVGSVASVINEGDLVCGIGWKGNEMPEKQHIFSQSKVYGVRGPLTKSLFEKCGADLSELKFEYDPGLLIKEVYNIDTNISKEKNVIFIPHYRDLWIYKGKYPKEIKVINIDNKPQVIANEILQAKVVYASSLHGIIFSHALGKECIFVKPQSDEPLFKYEDYYLSVGMNLPDPIENIYNINFKNDKGTSLNKQIGINDFYFPDKEMLIKNTILV